MNERDASVAYVTENVELIANKSLQKNNIFRTQDSSGSDFLCNSGIRELLRMTKYVVDQI